MRTDGLHTILLRNRGRSLVAGAVGLAAGVVLLFIAPEAFFPGYLVGFVFWTGTSLGCLGLLMLHHLVAGEWGFVARRILEAGARSVEVMALFFIPVLFGMQELYPWTHSASVASSEKLLHKAPYLNVPWFIVRGAIYFFAWIALAYLLTRWSTRLDETRRDRYFARMRRLSAVGLIAYVLLMTFAAVDWMMSVEPEWYSTIYGWMVEVSQILSAMTIVVVLLSLLRPWTPFSEVLRPKHLHDWGNLLLTFVILWAYLMFAQYLIIWSGNLPEEISWYTTRKVGGWFWIGPLLIIFHFALPFALLLLRRTKRHGRPLQAVAIGIFCAHAVYVAWLLLPAYDGSDALMILAAAVSFAGIGGCWITLFLTRLASRPILPRYDPRFTELLEGRAAS